MRSTLIATLAAAVAAAGAILPPSVEAFAPAVSHNSPAPRPPAALRRPRGPLRATAAESEDACLAAALAADGTLDPDVVYVLVYNPSTPQEGLHTVTHPRGSEEGEGTEYLLAFEYLADCVAFARVVIEDPTVDNGEPVPTPCSAAQIVAACGGMDPPLQIKVVPRQAGEEEE